MTDEQLMMQHVNGDPDAWEELMARHPDLPENVLNEIRDQPAWMWKAMYGRCSFRECVWIRSQDAETSQYIDDETFRRQIDFIITELVEDRIRLINRLRAYGEPFPDQVFA